MILKLYLITFYYLIEIVKLRNKVYDYNINLNKMNKIVDKYNIAIKPYMKIYNKNLNKQKEKTKEIYMKPIGINLERLCKEKFNINYDNFKHLPPNKIFIEIFKIIKKRRKDELLKNKIEISKPNIKL